MLILHLGECRKLLLKPQVAQYGGLRSVKIPIIDPFFCLMKLE